MSPQRTRMIDDMILGRSTSRRCAGWLRITTARPICSAKKRCGTTCSACASEAWHAAPSRSVITAYVSSTNTRSAVADNRHGVVPTFAGPAPV